MSHLEDKLAAFVYEELTASEMEEVRQHVAQCLECQGRVAEFQKMQHALAACRTNTKSIIQVMHMTVFTVSSWKGLSVKKKDLRRKSDRLLELVSDVEVPRRVVFVESRKSKTKTWLPLRWLVPAATAAALVLALVIGGPIQFDRQESGMTIAFGALPEAEPLQAATQPVVVEPQPVDYEQIVARVTSEQQPWLESEVESRIQRISAADGRKVQRLRAEMAYLSDLQRAALRDTMENASSIQLLAARTEVRE